MRYYFVLLTMNISQNQDVRCFRIHQCKIVKSSLGQSVRCFRMFSMSSLSTKKQYEQFKQCEQYEWWVVWVVWAVWVEWNCMRSINCMNSMISMSSMNIMSSMSSIKHCKLAALSRRQKPMLPGRWYLSMLPAGQQCLQFYNEFIKWWPSANIFQCWLRLITW